MYQNGQTTNTYFGTILLNYYTGQISLPQLFASLAVHPAVFFHHVTMLFALSTDGTAESRSN